MRAYLCALFLAVGVVGAMGEFLESQSFAAPFEDVGRDGQRVIARWKHGGNTDIHKSFIRLTPDRQSKRGYLWSQDNIGANEFTSTLKFRIAGQGKKFFGDGIAMWITQNPFYAEGSLHAFKEQFTGVGIIMDTFRNTEASHMHKDVTIIVNDGTITDSNELLGAAVGCDAKIRYHEARADFQVSNSSSVRVSIRNNQLTVKIDAKSDGDWVTCVENHDLELLNADWLTTARVGITASTGALADNHDVLALTSYTSLDAEAAADEAAAAEAAAKKPTGMNSARFNQMSDVVDDLAAQVETMHHHLEHQLAALRDGLQNTISKLQRQEDASEGRIDVLEEQLGARVLGQLEERISTLEKDTKANLDRELLARITKLERALDMKIDSSLADSIEQGSSWKTPFAVLVVILVAGGAGLYRWYQKLKKTHLL